MRISVVALAFLLAASARAQSPSPQAYTLVETNAMFGAEMQTEIYRDGNKALVDNSSAPGAAGAKVHTRTLYDLSAGRSFTLDLAHPSSGCGAGTFSGDWGDPFAFSAETLKEISGKNPKTAGTETIAGVNAKVLQVSDANSSFKLWVDDQYPLIMKLQMVPNGGAPQTMIAVKQFTVAKPAATLFALPPACVKEAAAPAAPTESQRIAAETGGNAGSYANAIMPPASKNSCTVLFKVVQAGTMQPITSGFQVALDTEVDINHLPGYTTSQDPRGHVTFSGGNIHEMTAQLRNGVLRIDNAPPQFNMEVAFGQAGDSSALIYRQCSGPQTTLLLVVKNPKKLSDGADWLWAK